MVGCSNMTQLSENSSDSTDTDIPHNVVNIIYDKDENVIGQIERYGMITMTDDSIIYAKVSDTSINERTYYRFVIKTKENIKLGTIKNWYYESAYNNTIINNHLYMRITRSDDKEKIITLYDIDLNNNTMSEVFSEKSDFSYNSMTMARNKLLLTRMIDGHCCLDEYNPENKEIKTIMDYGYFDDENNTGKAVRQITSDENTISALILKMETDKKVSMCIDTYDYEMNLLDSSDISILFKCSSSMDKFSQMRMPVSHFFILNNYIYYENFSVTKFLGKIKDNNIIENNLSFKSAYEAERNRDTKIFFRSDISNIYFFDTVSGDMKNTEFNINDNRYNIYSICRNKNDNLLITMGYKDENGETHLKLYYLNQSDLNFE